MVIIKLWGGIGNQLFQFVFGQYLSHRYDIDVKYDDNSYITTDQLRKREIDALTNSEEIEYNNVFSFSRYRGVKNRLLRYLFQLSPKHHFITERGMLPSYFKDNHIYYIQGYWQDYTYYKWLEDNNSFSIQAKGIPEVLSEYEKMINNTGIKSCSVHIRRGDYFLPKFVRTYGVCDADYYKKAMDLVKNKYDDVRFFFFSDDLDWVKANIVISTHDVIIENYDIPQFAYIDLMSKCHNHIISNSSFSWWGAVLNERDDAIVISPSKWQNNTDETIALDKWIKISVTNE